MIYATVHISITNKDSLSAYREKAGDALAKHGGAVLSAAPSPAVLEGDIPAPDMAAVLSFPDRDSALAWINDPELADTHALRRGAGSSAIVLVG
ncbi:DUF1330 domain-containing protein [Pseudohalocynthiibacter aestuariivivens]|uniref:DUF1330 domain-containing protein n=1 Tax=Pseudohalocynthiibacter aestuariivivens TaxID=1591409 RepID=A0ABV5JF75_9RHOB|nr:MULTISPECIES: DUF1330 domain-containing protein [Pseudohalocynthiibacter]MBS9717947.1 DUF1330 domain-containing protein [Pseudohalocynthiibacter aestuariivivens]MCK0103119.1 DUF1330 domain-containing protein [Pseudohalocynthiibacter sp. F2068]